MEKRVPQIKNILRLGGRVKYKLTPIHVVVTFGILVQGLLKPYGYLSIKTIESKVCSCCSLNHGKCKRRKAREGIIFALPHGTRSSTVKKQATCLTTRVIH